MRVSVIMGVYNAERTVSRAIESIINQEYDNWEMVICDDGSKDRTAEILQKYKSLYPDRFVIIRNSENQGLTYTLNHCLEYVDSEYVARMDADDISLPNRLSVEVDFLDNHPGYAFVGCAVERFDENGVWKKSYFQTSSPSKECFYKSAGFIHPTVMVRKSAYSLVNGYRETWYTNRCEDYDLWMRMYAKGLFGYNINSIMFQYYEGKDSFPKRKYKYRVGEAIMRAKGYAKLNMYPKGFIYVMKPLVAGLLPPKLVKRIHKN